MRALINGLVGGPELLVQWEHAWREQNGGEELDYASDGDADEEDGSDEEDEKPKKKAKVVADGPKAVAIPSVPAVGASAAQPDLKRKRGIRRGGVVLGFQHSYGVVGEEREFAAVAAVVVLRPVERE